MKIRGRRECVECGSHWSYYDTGAVACPECGSVRSRGLDDRERHTDGQASFDLTPIRNRVDEAELATLAGDAADLAAAYVRDRGFLDGGTLRLLDDTYVAASLCKHVGRAVARDLRPEDDAEYYLLSLLGEADEGGRPPAEEVPDQLRAPVGLALAAAVAAYQRDCRRVLEDESHPEAQRLAGRIRDHRKRVEALDGDVPPDDAERLLKAARDLGRFLRDGEESALVTADNWLTGIDA